MQISLRMLGLALVYFGTWTFFPLTAALVALLVATTIPPEFTE